VTGGETLLAGAALGLFSLPHCLAMCGPLAVSGTCRAGHSSGRLALGYLFGRVVAYATVGAVLGTVGGDLSRRMRDAGDLGRVALLAIAAVCAWQAWRVVRGTRHLKLRAHAPRRALHSRLMTWLTGMIPRRGMALGIVTAVLPCGALLAAWTLAAASGHPLHGAGAMTTFALASTPALVAAIVGRDLAARVMARVPKALAAVAWLSLALLLIGRAWPSSSCH
jgi:hypothetical protein